MMAFINRTIFKFLSYSTCRTTLIRHRIRRDGRNTSACATEGITLPNHTSRTFFIASRSTENVSRRSYSSLQEFKDNIVYVPVDRNGVQYKLGVIDVGERSHPVVLCSHGVPGSGEDFLHLVPSLLALKLRVLLPTYPGFQLSPLPEKDLFRLDHSTVEKAELLKLVCKHLNVDKVTVMMSHSQGTAAAYKFCADEPVESAIFFAACGEIPQRTAQPYRGLQLTATLLSNPVLRPLVSKLIILKYKQIGFSVTDLPLLQAAVLTVASVNFGDNLAYMRAIRDKKIPAVFMMAQNDRILEWERSFSLLQQVGFPSDNIVFYNDNREPSHLPNTDLDQDWYTRAFVVTKGGHNVHKSHQDLAEQALRDLLSYVRT